MGMNEGSERPSVAKDSADADGGKLSEMNILRVCNVCAPFVHGVNRLAKVHEWKYNFTKI